MRAGNQTNVSEAELEVLKVLWLRGPGTVRDVAQHLKQRDKQWVKQRIELRVKPRVRLLASLRDRLPAQLRVR